MSQVNPGGSSKKHVDPAIFTQRVEHDVKKKTEKVQDRSATFALQMAKSLAYALENQNLQMSEEIKSVQQTLIIQSLAQSFSTATSLPAVQEALNSLLGELSPKKYPEVIQWIEQQIKNVQSGISSYQSAYNYYIDQNNKLMNTINQWWDWTQKNHILPSEYTYNDFVTYMEGRGDPTPPGQHDSIGQFLEIAGPDVTYEEETTSKEYKNVQNAFGVYNGLQQTALQEFTTSMNTEANNLSQSLQKVATTEKQAVEMLKIQQKIISSLAFSAAGLPSNLE